MRPKHMGIAHESDRWENFRVFTLVTLRRQEVITSSKVIEGRTPNPRGGGGEFNFEFSGKNESRRVLGTDSHSASRDRSAPGTRIP